MTTVTKGRLMAFMMTNAIGHYEQSFTSCACSKRTKLLCCSINLCFRPCMFDFHASSSHCLYVSLSSLSLLIPQLFLLAFACPCTSFQVPPIIPLSAFFRLLSVPPILPALPFRFLPSFPLRLPLISFQFRPSSLSFPSSGFRLPCSSV